MPRRSAEDRSAASYRAKGKPPVPPAHLDPQAKVVWRTIAASRPPDFFTPGSLPLLESYVTALVMHRWYMNLWRTDSINRDNFVKPITALNVNLSMIATKLRLAITSVDKRSGLLTEREPTVDGLGGDDNVLLFGGPHEGRF
jgi:phage terminase small subunit